jgi:prostaglandin-endoperoxide synthase 2
LALGYPPSAFDRIEHRPALKARVADLRARSDALNAGGAENTILALLDLAAADEWASVVARREAHTACLEADRPNNLLQQRRPQNVWASPPRLTDEASAANSKWGGRQSSPSPAAGEAILFTPGGHQGEPTMNDSSADTANLISAVPDCPLEDMPPGEADAIARITQAIEARVRATAAADPPARRDAHAKMHGCVEAQLTVLSDLPPALAKGLFAQPATYQAWVRFSNGSGKPSPDGEPDGRGMAIKVLGVTGSRTGTQDFVMIDNPTFFVPNAAEYVEFNKRDNPFTFFVPDLNPMHIRLGDALTALQIAARRVSNPLNTQYWSMTPYLYGDVACKYSARPAGGRAPFEDHGGDDFLRENLVRSLDAGEAVFDFCIQLQGDPAHMPVEDPTVEWREEESPFVPVARLTIPRQGFDTPQRRAFGTNLSFTPWHGLDAHRPLGGVNRARRTVYETISRVRHDINGEERVEPASLTPAIAVDPPASAVAAAAADTFFDRFMGLAGEVVDAIPWADGAASMTVINSLVHSTTNRPHPWSTASDYTSWKALTDRTYQGRQLPVSTRDPADLPPLDKVVALFARPAGEQLLSPKSTCLFPAFAQYLTDGFIRTGVPGQPETAANRARTSSNHEIDLCPLYGRTEAQTNALRLRGEGEGERGRLLSQVVGGEEFAPFLYVDAGARVDPRFDGVRDAPLFGPVPPPPEQLASLFAFGGDRANSTPFSAMMNTLLLREHNRIAGVLEQQNPSWDDERVFQTARNILIPIFIKIVVEQYINHITPLPFNLVADPQVAWTADWNRPNWITAEFSLLYRWHSLVPDTIDWPGATIPLAAFGLDNRPLLASGLAAGFCAAAAQPAAELGALNTSAPLLMVEQFAIQQGRSNRLQSYNDYRVQYGMPRAATFEQISSHPAILAGLKAAYATPDDVEFYPGIFAEDRVPKSPLPGLLMRMVGVDAFSQALTNPLLSQHVFNAATFSPWGLELINDTHNLGQILARNCAAGAANPEDIVMTQKSWRY